MSINEFVEAAKTWHQLKNKVENDVYYIQQEALCTYKSKEPDTITALKKALKIIGQIKNGNDTETLGIAGAINKNLWIELKDKGLSYLDTAIECYKKGWNLYGDYYTGENYAFCTEQKSMHVQDAQLKTYYKIDAQMTRKKIIEIILPTLNETIKEEDRKWKYASLSNCYLAIGEKETALEYEKLFLEMKPKDWEKETFETTKKALLKILTNKSVYK